MSGTIHSKIENGVCTLTIDNQEKRNALSPSILSGIVREIDSLKSRSSIPVVIFTGSGKDSFSSGYDISELEQGNYLGETRELYDQVMTQVYEYPYPTIAMINGHVFGGAMELISACDLRIGVDDALFGIPPAKLGLIYGDRGINRVMDHLGAANTKELLFTGEPINAKRAAEDGLLNHVVSRKNLEKRTYEIAEQIAGNAPLSLKGMKRIIQTLIEKRSLTNGEKEWVDKLRVEAAQSKYHAEALEEFTTNKE